MDNIPGGKKRTVPDKYRNVRDKWLRMIKIWQIAHYGLGGLAIALSGLVDVAPSPLEGDRLRWIAGIAAALMALVTAWAPVKKMKAYAIALNRLQDICRRYEFEDAGYTEKHLNDALQEGEAIITEA